VGKDGVSYRLVFQLYTCIMLMLGNGGNCSPLLLHFIISCCLDTGKSNRNVKPLRCQIKKKKKKKKKKKEKKKKKTRHLFNFSFGKSDTM
jgi:hypothetical protein